MEKARNNHSGSLFRGPRVYHDHAHGLALTTVLCKLRGDAWEGTRDFVQTPRVWKMLQSQFPNPGLLDTLPSVSAQEHTHGRGGLHGGSHLPSLFPRSASPTMRQKDAPLSHLTPSRAVLPWSTEQGDTAAKAQGPLKSRRYEPPDLPRKDVLPTKFTSYI